MKHVFNPKKCSHMVEGIVNQVCLCSKKYKNTTKYSECELQSYFQFSFFISENDPTKKVLTI